MSATRDPEIIVAAWLDEGPTDLPDVTRRAILTAIPTTPQARRGFFASGSFLHVNSYARLAVAALVVAVSLGGLRYVLGPGPGPGGPEATPTPTPALPTQTPAPAPTVALDTSKWVSFTSPLYGYSMSFPGTPAGWINAPATQVWAGETLSEMWTSAANAPWVDKFYSQATGITMTAVAIPFEAGTAEAPWIDAYVAPPTGPAPSCVITAAAATAIVIDGHPGLISTSCASDRAAFVVVGARIFVFSISTPSDVELFTTFLSTVRLPKA